jgi:hypothetical protein
MNSPIYLTEGTCRPLAAKDGLMGAVGNAF